MEHANESDEDLMLRVKRGDAKPLSLLVRRYANSLLTFIFRINGNRHRSEELFQEAFLKVWKARRTYAYPRPFRCWLFGIAANACRAEHRRRPAPVTTLDHPVVQAVSASSRAPLDEAIAIETGSLVEQAIERLPDQQRTVVVMRTWSGFSYAEISQAIGSSESTVRSQMCQGLQAMRKFLEPRMRE
jgi:RNA polymerase sigma-70 factor (ECF subfamily)